MECWLPPQSWRRPMRASVAHEPRAASQSSGSCVTSALRCYFWCAGQRRKQKASFPWSTARMIFPDRQCLNCFTKMQPHREVFAGLVMLVLLSLQMLAVGTEPTCSLEWRATKNWDISSKANVAERRSVDPALKRVGPLLSVSFFCGLSPQIHDPAFDALLDHRSPQSLRRLR